MKKKYYEVVFEGNIKIIRGMLEGFILGKEATWEWYSSRESEIETETLADIIKELVTLKSRFHHIIMEEIFIKTFTEIISERTDLKYVKQKYIRSARTIKSCSFKFTAGTYAKNYADEIKNLITSPRDGVSIENFNIEELNSESDNDIELYSPIENYEFWCEGIAVGSFGEIIDFRNMLTEHPLIKVNRVKLNF